MLLWYNIRIDLKRKKKYYVGGTAEFNKKSITFFFSVYWFKKYVLYQSAASFNAIKFFNKNNVIMQFCIGNQVSHFSFSFSHKFKIAIAFKN